MGRRTYARDSVVVLRPSSTRDDRWLFAHTASEEKLIQHHQNSQRSLSEISRSLLSLAWLHFACSARCIRTRLHSLACAHVSLLAPPHTAFVSLRPLPSDGYTSLRFRHGTRDAAASAIVRSRHLRRASSERCERRRDQRARPHCDSRRRHTQPVRIGLCCRGPGVDTSVLRARLGRRRSDQRPGAGGPLLQVERYIERGCLVVCRRLGTWQCRAQVERVPLDEH